MRKPILVLLALGLIHCKSVEDPQSLPRIFEGKPSELDMVVKLDINGALCSGTLLSPTALLTAVHCLGDLTTGSVKLAEWGARSVKVFVHATVDEAFRKELRDMVQNKVVRTEETVARLKEMGEYDVAILGLDRAVTLDRYAALPDVGKVYDDLPLRLYGFGNDQIDLSIDDQGGAKATPKGAGKRRYLDARIETKTDRLITLGKDFGEKVAASLGGDSGGVLLAASAGSPPVALGVVSGSDLGVNRSGDVRGSTFLANTQSRIVQEIVAAVRACQGEGCPSLDSDVNADAAEQPTDAGSATKSLPFRNFVTRIADWETFRGAIVDDFKRVLLREVPDLGTTDPRAIGIYPVDSNEGYGIGVQSRSGRNLGLVIIGRQGQLVRFQPL